ncbi:MAG: hypothetical protein ACE5G6_04875 [Terriglobia bacterium]
MPAPSPRLSPTPSSAAPRLRCLVLCLHCGERWRVELLHGDVLVLDRDGTLQLSCPACALYARHSLVRFGS